MLAVGRLHPVKDHAFLIRACELLKNRGLPFTCVIAGEGPERTSIEALIEELNLKLTCGSLDTCPRSISMPATQVLTWSSSPVGARVFRSF